MIHFALLLKIYRKVYLKLAESFQVGKRKLKIALGLSDPSEAKFATVLSRRQSLLSIYDIHDYHNL